MSDTTPPKGVQTPTATTTAGGENRQAVKMRHRVEGVLWVLGLMVFVASCFVIHAHPQPYPFELAMTQTVKGFHPWPWVTPVLEFPSTLNDPLPSAVALGSWLGGMVLMAVIVRLRQRSALSWIQAALFLAVTVMSSAGKRAACIQ